METINLMEVCGTHTMSIARSGIKSLLPEGIRLLSGPGCPVCVTPPEVIDTILKLSERKDVVITTYGDLMKVPGSRKGESLLKKKALGAAVEMVYSPLDALEIAKQYPDKEVVFLGAGFETTAPGTAACIRAAASEDIRNFSVFCMLKTIEPALRTLIGSPDFNVQGFLCPGHVAVILGEEGFRFLAEEYHIPAVIAGFEAEEILLAVKLLLRQISEGKAVLENAYPKAVEAEGNLLAKSIMQEVFVTTREASDDSCRTHAKVPDGVNDIFADFWRGLGMIPGSGYLLRPEYEAFDAVKKFEILPEPAPQESACRCGDVICGRIAPADCPMFGKACTPEDPEGPCMVSSEGACAAAYLYI